MDVWQQACATLLHTFPTFASGHSVIFTDECAAYLRVRSWNDIWAKKNPHVFEDVAQHPPHVTMWAGVTSDLIIGPYFFDVSVTGGSYLELVSH
jgi:hypothetical protein